MKYKNNTLMININILHVVNDFIKHFYPESNEILLFGSAAKKTIEYQDIDLLILDHINSYTSKSTIIHNNIKFSIIKVFSYDLFDIIAEDYQKGIYRNIFETGYIIKDETKVLSLAKNYVCKNYPNNNDAVLFNINRCVFRINESIHGLKVNNETIETFLLFSDLVNLLLDFLILKDGRTNFTSAKHKSQYLRQYHLAFVLLMNETIELYKKSPKKAISKIISLAYSHGVPFVTKYSSDYFIENIKDLTSFVLFIPDLSDKQDYEKLYKKIVTFNVQFYSYWIDKNNIEKSGFYFILKDVETVLFLEIKEQLLKLLNGKPVFFPYNIAFSQEIKFGGYTNYEISEKLFISIQVLINSIRHNPKQYQFFILCIINNLSISFEEVYTYYFYKTINKSNIISNTVDSKSKKKFNKDEANKITNCSEIFNSFQIDSRDDVNFNFRLFDAVPKYFLIQIIDRILSMLLLKDIEKIQIMHLLRTQNFTNVQ